MLVLRKAKNSDRSALLELLTEAKMRYVEPIKAYTLALEGASIAGCARLEDHGDTVMLRPLVVAEKYRRKRLGDNMLKRIMPHDKPTIVAARGEAIPFYVAIGFNKTGWHAVSDEQRDECKLCPERKVCNPQPMIYVPHSCENEHTINQSQNG
jgi:N-acetylglutamate synthase-like GNAT family acetyltransferase